MDLSEYITFLFMGFCLGLIIGLVFSPIVIKSNKSELKPYRIIITENDTTYYYNE